MDPRYQPAGMTTGLQSLFLVMPDMCNRASIPPPVMPDMCNRASIFAVSFRMDPRDQPAGMTKNKEPCGDNGLLLA